MPDSVFASIEPFFTQISKVALDGWGEPLTDPDIFRRTRICHDAGCYTQFATNATLLTEDKLPDLFESGLDLLLVSIDGAFKETYETIRLGADFDQVIDNVRSVVKARGLRGSTKPEVTLVYTLTRTNKDETTEFASLAAGLQADSIIIKQLDVFGKETDLAETLVYEDCSEILADVKGALLGTATRLDPFSRLYLGESKLEKGCLANVPHTAFVSWQGDVSPCCNLGHRVPRLTRAGENAERYVADSFLSFGNVCLEGLDHVWNKDSYRKFRRTLAAGSLPEPCKGCNLIWPGFPK